VLPCRELTSALDFYTTELGFRIDLIYPADAPRVAELSGHGLGIRLERDDESSVTAAQTTGDEWGTGRAGMQYRDLIPDRCGGRIIASHIRIPNGGPVPDYVHHHDVRFQMIYCYKGWVKVVYEDQGPPLVMQAGDCVLQPPHIRHRVLECSDNMEVIEVTGPAEHETLVDHELELPTKGVNRDRDFKGQRFVYHESRKASWLPGSFAGFEARDCGIGSSTNGLARVQVIRASGTAPATLATQDVELAFNFVLQGSLSLQRKSEARQRLTDGDAFIIAAGAEASISDFSKDLELLQVAFQSGLLSRGEPC